MVGTEISLPALEFALVALKMPSKEELVHLKVLTQIFLSLESFWKVETNKRCRTALFGVS